MQSLACVICSPRYLRKAGAESCIVACCTCDDGHSSDETTALLEKRPVAMSDECNAAAGASSPSLSLSRCPSNRFKCINGCIDSFNSTASESIDLMQVQAQAGKEMSTLSRWALDIRIDLGSRTACVAVRLHKRSFESRCFMWSNARSHLSSISSLLVGHMSVLQEL